MKMIKRELLLCLTLTAFVFVCALAWGHPFLSIESGSAVAHVQQTSSHFTGTMLESGQQFLLRDSSGQLFHLDAPAHAQSLEGKAVDITGKLDEASKTIYVETIAAATI